MKFSLNQKQREILYCFFNNGVCFVNASAGTGKTSTITELYLELLRKKEKVSNIVVITFTKAAANEMLIRIRLKIRNEIKEAKSENDKKYWQNIYRDILTSAKISTINSFAHSIVLEHSMGLSMPPNIAILEDSSEFNNRLKDEILNVLKDVSYTEKIRKLYRIYTEESKNQFADKILKFLIKIKPRLENIENFEKKALEIINIDKKGYDKLYNDIYNHSIDLIDDKSKTGKYINDCQNKLSLLIEKIDLIKDKENVKALHIEDYEYITNALYEASQAKLGNTKHDDFRAVLSALQSLCITMINYVNILYNEENYITVINFIKDTFNRFEYVKKIIGAYSYEDIMHKAIEALENDNISKEIRENISTLILDEAQDTSSLQFAFMNLIAFGKREIKIGDKTNKKIMIVGDRKQSIYRFRNANLNAFTKTQEMFEENIRYLKDNYTFISEMQVSPTSQSVLNDKLHTAYNAWMRSAGGQYEVAEDVGTAISYYHIAAALTSTDEVKNALTDIANSHDCPGAYLGVTSTQIEYGQLLINYSGICTTDTHAVIQYKISSGPGDSSNAITGQAEMTIQPGNGQQVIISLNKTPQQSQRYVELSSNGMTFYRQQSE